MSATTTGTRSEPTTTRPGLLHGLTWLVLRQHRAAAIGFLALAVLGAIWIVYQRSELIELIDTAERTGKELELPVLGQQYDYLSLLLGGLPVILAVFLGAPLIAADREQGTAQLATTQSVTRRRWLTAKLTYCFLIVLVAGSVLSAVFTWWWEPNRSFFGQTWAESGIFDNTGPMLPALALFLTAAGVTIGVLLRRVLASMMVTFVFCMAVQIAWDLVREHLASPRTITYPLNSEPPSRLAESHEVDRWVASADGQLYGWGTCAEATEKAQNACIEKNGIVNNVFEYLDYGQMAAMQWTGAGLLLAGTAALTGFVVWRVSRHPL